MSEFKTFGLDEAKVLDNHGIRLEDKCTGLGALGKQTTEWLESSGVELTSGVAGPNAVYRLAPEQELTFEQACLLVGLGLGDELQDWCPAPSEWRGDWHNDGIQPHRNYRTRPLPKQTKIIPHTMETAPEEKTVRHPDYGTGLAVPTNSGRLFVDWAKGPAMFYPFDKAVDELTIVDRFGPNTGKPYGMEVEA